MEFESSAVRLLVGLSSAMIAYWLVYFVIVKLVKPKKLWWFAICIPLVLLFLWLAFWVMPQQSGNLILAGVQWGIFGFALHSYNMARKHWPEGR